MAMSKKRLTASLEKLALSDLRRRFEQETGETNRTPNRAFLIRRIVEAVEVARHARKSEPDAASPSVAPQDGARENPAASVQRASQVLSVPGSVGDQSSPPEPPAPLASTPEGDEAQGAAGGGEAPESSPAALPQPARGTVRIEQVRGTATVLDSDSATDSCLAENDPVVEGSLAADAPRMPRGALTGLTVEQLQAKYVEVVGRPTGSSDKAYLVWKIREAFKGKVPRGPREPKRRTALAQDVMVLPLRLPARTVDAMDHVWHALGIRTRTDFLLDAIRLHLERLDAPEAAAHFAR